MTDRYVKMVNGEEIPMTPDEIAARQAEEAIGPPPPTLGMRLDSIFSSLPVEVRAQFYHLKAGIKVALEERDMPVAKAIIQGVTVPSELEAVRQSLLQLFA